MLKNECEINSFLNFRPTDKLENEKKFLKKFGNLSFFQIIRLFLKEKKILRN